MGHLEPSCPTMKSIVFFAVIAAAFAGQNLNQRLIPKLIPTCYMGDIILMLMVMLDIMDILILMDIMDIHMLTMAKGLLSQLLNQKLIQRLILTCCMVDIMDILMLMDIMDIHIMVTMARDLLSQLLNQKL